MQQNTINKLEQELKNMGVSEFAISLIHEMKNEITDDMVRRVIRKDCEYDMKTRKFLLAHDLFRNSLLALTEICTTFSDYANLDFVSLLIEIGIPFVYNSSIKSMSDLLTEPINEGAFVHESSSIH